MVLPYVHRLMVNLPGGGGYCEAAHTAQHNRWYTVCIALTLLCNLLYVCATAVGNSLDAHSNEEKISSLRYWLPALAVAATFAGGYAVLAWGESVLWLPVPCSSLLRALTSRLDWKDALSVKAFAYDSLLVLFGLAIKIFGSHTATAEEKNMILDKGRPLVDRVNHFKVSEHEDCGRM